MCDTCGCGDPNLVAVDVHDDILAKNKHQARHNRQHFGRAGVTAFNLMGSPGSGKTALLQATAQILDGVSTMAAISGDLDTDHDARRLRAAGVPAVSITTGSACHLDAQMVHDSLDKLDWKSRDFLFIENVGNLVCPAIYDLGEVARVVTLSVTEGEDKPLKYPVMFRTADLVLLTKVDLLPYLDVSVPMIRDALSRVMPRPDLLPVSAQSGVGMSSWLAWLFDVIENHRTPTVPQNGARRP